MTTCPLDTSRCMFEITSTNTQTDCSCLFCLLPGLLPGYYASGTVSSGATQGALIGTLCPVGYFCPGSSDADTEDVDTITFTFSDTGPVPSATLTDDAKVKRCDAEFEFVVSGTATAAALWTRSLGATSPSDCCKLVALNLCKSCIMHGRNNMLTYIRLSVDGGPVFFTFQGMLATANRCYCAVYTGSARFLQTVINACVCSLHGHPCYCWSTHAQRFSVSGVLQCCCCCCCCFHCSYPSWSLCASRGDCWFRNIHSDCMC